MLRVLLDEHEFSKCASLRAVFCGGETLTRDVQEKFFKRLSCPLHNLYGPTEAAIDSTHWECRRDFNGSVMPIGRPIANTRIYILDGYLNPVSVGVPGEIYIGGAGLARGYLNRPELTQEKFIPNPFNRDHDSRLYKSGDRARYLPDGNIEFLGRMDDQVKIRGYRIELGEIEAVLGQHPAIREAVVLAREDTPGDKRLVGYVVMRTGVQARVDELRDFLKQKLPDYMIPSAWIPLDQLPLLPSGKVERGKLPAPDQI